MQIDFELPGKVNEARINFEMLPEGYVSEQISDGRFWVLTEAERVPVGTCEMKAPFVRVTFHTLIPEGRDFLTAFGRRFPEHNPTTLFFGFVYKSPNGLFQLDKIPLRLKSEAVKEIKHYVSARNAFLVSFYRGDWTDTSLEVLSMRKVLGDGVLGDEKGPLSLTLGKEEK